MKILYVASNPDQQNTLLLEREITLIQQKLSSISSSLAPLEFIPFPHIEPNDLLDELRHRPPDILHLSAHAGINGVVMESSGQQLWISAAKLTKLLRALPVRPRLVYLNACNSAEIASHLTNEGVVDFAIGAQVPIQNGPAIKTAAIFYDWLARGHSVQAAYDAASALLDIFQDQENALVLKCHTGAKPECTQLQAIPMIVARVPRIQAGTNKGKLRLDRKADGFYNIEFGILNCPPDTTQVVFFVDDWSFIQDENSLEEDLCEVKREEAKEAELWFDSQWDANKDYHVYATGVRARGETFTISSSPSEALKTGIQKNVLGCLNEQERKKVIEIVNELRKIP